MTPRDLAWRLTGTSLIGVSCFASAFASINNVEAGPAETLLGFATMILGIVLLIQGKRVPAMLRIELSRHRALPLAIRAWHHATTRRIAD